jgi:predicted alpha/beta superfamily hydrolase
MENLLLIFVLAVLISASGLSQNKITIKVITPGIDPVSSVYITGNNSKLGGWNPSAVKLERINDTLWTKIFYFKTDESLEFKFTKGSWNTEALTENNEVPQNNTFLVSADTVLFYSIKKWKDGANYAVQSNFKGQITGTVKYIYKMEGKGINPRDLIIWLPPSYNSDTNKRYPVLYMHDGQNLFDPKTSTFGVDWQLDEAADSLIKSRAIKEIIIVGIYNTPDRAAEYGDTQTGHFYMDFIINTIKPYIDRNFRTLPDRQNTATGGSSLGGLISFMLVWEHPEIFSKAACLSPAFHIEDIDYIEKVKNYSLDKKSLKIYIDIGTIGLESRLKPGIDEMIFELKKKGYQLGTDIDYFIDEGAIHNETAWAKRNWRYLEFLFKK